MNGVTAMLVVLGLSGAARAPDLEVEARTALGASHPELAEAVARALVAGGARVVLKAPASPPCQYCAKVAVVESGRDVCKIEVTQDRHRATAVLHLPASSPLLDRARAIAIQARLLVTWESSLEPRTPKTRAPARKSDSASVEPASATAAGPVEPTVTAPAPLAAIPVPPEPPPPERPAPASAPPRPPVAAIAGGSRPAPTTPSVRPTVRTNEPKPTEARPRLPLEAASSEVARREAPVPTPVELRATTPATKSRWPWIPTAIGAGAAVAAMVCAGLARDRYNALADRSRSYASAQSIKTEGERWQLASFVLAGAATVGVGTGIVGFVTRGPVTAAASPLPGGGMIAVRGELP